MGRLRHHRYHRRYHRWGPARGPVGPLLMLMLLLGAAVLAVVGLLAVALVTVLMRFGPIMLFGVASVVMLRHLRRHSLGPRHPAPSAPRGPAIPDWHATRARFAQLRSEYGQFECDPLAVLRLPALTDVTVPSTGRFVEAFAQAQALDTDNEPPPAHVAHFASAVDQAWRTWRAARDAAQRIRLAGIPAPERAGVERAIKLLTMARDSDHDAERIAAYAKARAELAKLDRSGALRLPPAAAAALETAARGQLPTSKTAG